MNRIEVFCFKNNFYKHFNVADIFEFDTDIDSQDNMLTNVFQKIRKNLKYDVIVIYNENTNNIIKIGGVSNVQR